MKLLTKHQRIATPITDNAKLALTKYIRLLRKNTSQTEIPSNIAFMYSGDFYSLLQHLKVKSDLFFITLLLNNLTASYQYEGTVTTIILPPDTIDIKDVIILLKKK